MNSRRDVIWFCVLVVASILATIPFVIRSQNSIPQSENKLWETLATSPVKMDYRKLRYHIDYSLEVKALDGKTLTIDGYMMPLEATPKFTHFLLTKRSPSCPYCPPGRPNEIIEVFLNQPISWDERMITITGTMALTEQAELGLFYQLKKAVKIAQ